MVQIAPNEFDAFRDDARSVFEAEMLKHLQQFSPPLFSAVGEPAMQSFVRFGIERAKQYGYVLRGPVRLYLELMLLFGSYFTEDPQYPWAKRGHASVEQAAATSPAEMEHAQALYENACEYRKHVAGPDDQFGLAALKRLHTQAESSQDIPDTDTIRFVSQSLRNIYAQKADYIGENVVVALVQEATTMAQQYGLQQGRGVAMLSALMLALGRGCVEDPLYPWIKQTLVDEKIVNSQARVQRLETRSLSWLSQVVKFLEGPSK